MHHTIECATGRHDDCSSFVVSEPCACRCHALSQPHTEPMLNGRCIGQLTYNETHGTTLVAIWHDPDGCEHKSGAS